jgi:hypothetical protein
MIPVVIPQRVVRRRKARPTSERERESKRKMTAENKKLEDAV